MEVTYYMRIYKSADELPATLNAEDIASYLNISKAMAYNIFKQKDFPTLQIGTRLVVPKDHFLEWVEQNINKK